MRCLTVAKPIDTAKSRIKDTSDALDSFQPRIVLPQRCHTITARTRGFCNHPWYVYCSHFSWHAFTRPSEIQYNICGRRIPNIPNDKGPGHKFHYFSTLRFQYNFRNGKTMYQIFRAENDLKYYREQPPNLEVLTQALVHPFALHLVFLFTGALCRSGELEDLSHRLQTLERQLLRQDSRVTAETAQDTKFHLQTLHQLFREMVASENVNKRDLAAAKCLLSDLKRLQKLARTSQDPYPLDEESHQRVTDGLLFLKSFCEGREVRLASRSRRVENLISLVRFLDNVGAAA